MHRLASTVALRGAPHIRRCALDRAGLHLISRRRIWELDVEDHPMGDRGRLDAATGLALRPDVRDVDAGGLAADEERVADLAVRPARREEAQDLHLARR